MTLNTPKYTKFETFELASELGDYYKPHGCIICSAYGSLA